MQRIVVGNVVTVRLTFASVASGSLVDPTSVRAVVADPSGAETVYVYGTDAELTRTSTGVYKLRVATDLASSSDVGVWRGTGYSTGTAQAAVQFEFEVLPVAVAP